MYILVLLTRQYHELPIPASHTRTMLPNSATHTFMQLRLGLSQASRGSGTARVRGPPAAPAKRTGFIIWDSVTVLVEHATSPKVKCNLGSIQVSRNPLGNLTRPSKTKFRKFP